MAAQSEEETEQEFEQVWDIVGIGLTLTSVLSYMLIFTGYNPVFNRFTTEIVTGHLLAIGLGFVLTEGGTRKLVSESLDVLQN